MLNKFNKIDNLPRDEFIKIFGSKNEKKNNRCSWSGKCFPKYGKWNDYGQTIICDSKNNIFIVYSKKHDNYISDKPKHLKKDKLLLAYWSYETLKRKIENKFNNRGFIIFSKTKNVYDKLSIGKKITFDNWIDNFKKGIIFLDSGMYETNSRNYSHWRAPHKFWENLIIEEHQ